MLVAAAVCPHPPLLLPGVDPGEGPELFDLRRRCHQAVAALTGSPAELIVVVGAADQTGPFPPESRGSLAGYGVDRSARAGPTAPSLPLSLTVGQWLLDETGSDVERLLFGVVGDAEAQRCADLGAGMGDRAARVAMLAMGDGSARRSLKGPAYLDPRAEPFDRRVAEALSDGDTTALLALEAELADELLVAGRSTWQVLAGAARASGADWVGNVSFAAAPYGVSYVVATWLPARAP